MRRTLIALLAAVLLPSMAYAGSQWTTCESCPIPCEDCPIAKR